MLSLLLSLAQGTQNPYDACELRPPSPYSLHSLDWTVTCGGGSTGDATFGATDVGDFTGNLVADLAQIEGGRAFLVFEPNLMAAVAEVDPALVGDAHDVLFNPGRGTSGIGSSLVVAADSGLLEYRYTGTAISAPPGVIEADLLLGARQVECVDFFGDGVNDLVALNAAGDRIVPLIRLPDETYVTGVELEIQHPTDVAHEFAVLDWDGDGFLEVACRVGPRLHVYRRDVEDADDDGDTLEWFLYEDIRGYVVGGSLGVLDGPKTGQPTDTLLWLVRSPQDTFDLLIAMNEFSLTARALLLDLPEESGPQDPSLVDVRADRLAVEPDPYGQQDVLVTFHAQQRALVLFNDGANSLLLDPQSPELVELSATPFAEATQLGEPQFADMDRRRMPMPLVAVSDSNRIELIEAQVPEGGQQELLMPGGCAADYKTPDLVDFMRYVPLNGGLDGGTLQLHLNVPECYAVEFRYVQIVLWRQTGPQSPLDYVPQANFMVDLCDQIIGSPFAPHAIEALSVPTLGLSWPTPPNQQQRHWYTAFRWVNLDENEVVVDASPSFLAGFTLDSDSDTSTLTPNFADAITALPGASAFDPGNLADPFIVWSRDELYGPLCGTGSDGSTQESPAAGESSPLGAYVPIAVLPQMSFNEVPNRVPPNLDHLTIPWVQALTQD